MQFINESRWPARFFFGGAEENVNVGWLVARATFRLEGDGHLVPAAEPWPVFAQPVRTAHGVFPSDDVASRTGCDVVVTGTATSSKPVTWLEASVRAGAHANDVLVIGDRVWRKAGGTLIATDPRPFMEMPVDWTRALGGTISQDGVGVPDAFNPSGRGAYLSADAAVNGLLPNLEDRHDRISNWNDRPMPVAWGPIANAPVWQMAQWIRERSRNQSPVTVQEARARAAECVMCAAPPRNVIPGLYDGDPVDIAFGENRASFYVPPLGLVVHAANGVDRIDCPLAYSGIWVMLDTRLVVLTLRASFRYAVRRGETRVAVLRALHGLERAS
ncbi:DUF2169 domain-containing protein [Pendulispora brunnea]|uniref:DUF2169 domain-containing protein n=1 Tax=Pendulispora brunnea TaxID=2905690 RepID=A0ABZ2KA62_9BACT